MALCIAIIALMLLIDDREEYLEVKSNESITASVVNIAEEKYAGDDIDESILIMDDEDEVSTTTLSAPAGPAVPKPHITAEAYLVGNLDTGEIYLKHNTKEIFPIASVSKLYTALVVHHLFNLEDRITITEPMLIPYGSAGDLKVGDRLLPNELLHALLLESSNDAAEAFALSFEYEKFMEQMNAFAREIGMSNTSFEDPSGLSPLNVSNADDLFILSKYLYKSEKDILDISKTTDKTLDGDQYKMSNHFTNIHPYAGRGDFMGGKTGRTSEAKESMITMLKYDSDGVEYPIVLIVLRSDFGERKTNTDKLLVMLSKKI